jgi:hypothetical protein
MPSLASGPPTLSFSLSLSRSVFSFSVYLSDDRVRRDFFGYLYEGRPRVFLSGRLSFLLSLSTSPLSTAFVACCNPSKSSPHRLLWRLFRLPSSCITLTIPTSIFSQVRRRRQTGDLPPVYPNGWYRICEAKDLKSGGAQRQSQQTPRGGRPCLLLS